MLDPTDYSPPEDPIDVKLVFANARRHRASVEKVEVTVRCCDDPTLGIHNVDGYSERGRAWTLYCEACDTTIAEIATV